MFDLTLRCESEIKCLPLSPPDGQRPGSSSKPIGPPCLSGPFRNESSPIPFVYKELITEFAQKIKPNIFHKPAEGEGLRYEITIEGPFLAMMTLRHELRRFSPTLKRLPHRPNRKVNWASISCVETNDTLLNAKLLEISKIISHIEEGLSPRENLDIRIRNLSYSEPCAGSSQFDEPFKPIPSLTVLPWKPSHRELIDSHTIVLDPEHAFGSGKHPSTKLCLNILDRMLKNKTQAPKFQKGRLLDFGCGTGILAIAAVKMGMKSAVGVENDADAAESAERNVMLNHLSHKIDIRVGSWNVVNEAYDLIVSNLVVSALLRTGKKFPDHLEIGGAAVIAGFGENQLTEMKDFFYKMGLIPSGQNTLAGWAALTLRKRR